MSNAIKTIIEDEKFNFDTQIQLCETIILSLSKKQLNECSIKHSYISIIQNVIDRPLSLLMYLVMNKKYECLINFLLTNRKDDIDINLSNSINGWSALFYAVRYSNKYSSENIVKILIDAGANINTYDKYEQSLLYLTMLCDESSDNTIQILIDAGVNINIKNKHEQQQFMFLLNNHTEKTKISKKIIILTHAGIDINFQDPDGLTLLMHVIKQISPNDLNINNTIIALLKAGADINIKDNEGKTVFDYVHSEVKNELINAISTIQQSKELIVEKTKSATLEQELMTGKEKIAALEQELVAEKDKNIKRQQQMNEIIQKLQLLINNFNP